MGLPEGVYVLLIELSNDESFIIGALGRLTFEKGLYAYVGSAQKNLEQRVNRHFRKEKRLFWHVDYLLDSNATKIAGVFYKKAEKSAECTTASKIDSFGKRVDGFGCSDCSCKSHLFHVDGGGISRLRDFLSCNFLSLAL